MVLIIEWLEGDSNYLINLKLVFINYLNVVILGGFMIEFLMLMLSGDIVKDWSGVGLKVIESGYTGSNFLVNGEKKLFYKVVVILCLIEMIFVGGEYSVDMVYYILVFGVVNGVCFIVGNEMVGLKKDFLILLVFEGVIDGGNGNEGGVG